MLSPSAPPALEPLEDRAALGFDPARVVAGLGLFTGLAACAVLIGWKLDIRVLKSIAPGYITMKANTAAALGLLALALLSSQFHRGRPAVRAAGLACSAVVALIAVLTLAEYLGHVDLGLDELLFRDPDGAGGRFPPGRLAPVTAVSLLVVAASDFLSAARWRRAGALGQALTLVAFLASFQAIVGYASGVTYNFGSAFYTQIALHTAVLLSLLCIGQLLLRPRDGLMEVLGARTEGGSVARRLIASAMLVPPLVNTLQLRGQRLGLYDADFGVLLRVIGNSVFFTLIVWRNALALHRADLRRRELLSRQEQLLAAEQTARGRAEDALRIRDEFLTIAAHELNTPLTPLLLQLQFIQRQLGAKQVAQQRSVEVALRQTQRFQALVGAMLDTSRLASHSLSLEREPVDLQALVAEVAARFREPAESAGSRLEVVEGKPVVGSWDRARLDQVLGHLVANAIRYGQGRPIRLQVSAGPQSARLEVVDRGVGIQAADQQRIFGRFERAAPVNSYGGLGLGLYIARELVQAHGGVISVTSTPGAGSTFAVELPLGESALPG